MIRVIDQAGVLVQKYSLCFLEGDAMLEVDPIGWTRKSPFLDGVAG